MVLAFVRMGDIHLVGDDIREIWSEAGNHDIGEVLVEFWGCENPEAAGK